MPWQFRTIHGPTSAVRLSITESMPRVVHEQKFAADHAGTITVPDFDTDHGMFYASPCVRHYGPPAELAFEYQSNVICHPFPLPSLSWDNDTKIMTIAPVSFPAGWPYYGTVGRADYWLVFLALHKRITVS